MSGGVFECPVPVRWSDQDANGHVNNARVVTPLEEIRIAAYLAWLDSTPDSGLPRVVRTLTVDFRRAVHHRGALTGRLWVSRIGGSSFVMQHALVQDGIPVVTAEATVVQLEPDHSRSRPLEADLRGILEAVHRPGVTAADEATAAARQTTSPPTDHGAPPPPADRRS